MKASRLFWRANVGGITQGEAEWTMGAWGSVGTTGFEVDVERGTALVAGEVLGWPVRVELRARRCPVNTPFAVVRCPQGCGRSLRLLLLDPATGEVGCRACVRATYAGWNAWTERRAWVRRNPEALMEEAVCGRAGPMKWARSALARTGLRPASIVVRGRGHPHPGTE